MCNLIVGNAVCPVPAKRCCCRERGLSRSGEATFSRQNGHDIGGEATHNVIRMLLLSVPVYSLGIFRKEQAPSVHDDNYHDVAHIYHIQRRIVGGNG
jgi:hypothetical protein